MDQAALLGKKTRDGGLVAAVVDGAEKEGDLAFGASREREGQFFLFRLVD